MRIERDAHRAPPPPAGRLNPKRARVTLLGLDAAPQAPPAAAVVVATSEATHAGSRVYLPLARETRHAVDTDTAAHHLSRRAQTLRVWACSDSGPISPLRVHGRLLWRVDDLRRLLDCLEIQA